MLCSNFLFPIFCCSFEGDAGVETAQAMEGVFVNSGDNPFELIKDSIKYVLLLFQDFGFRHQASDSLSL